MAETTAKSSVRKRILLMINPAQAHARGVLEGIADYIDHHTRWENLLVADLNPLMLKRRDVDGVISEASNPEMAAALRRVRVPTLTVAGTPVASGPPAVIVDNRAVGRVAGDHMADLGLKHVGYVPTPRAHYSAMREAGLREVAERRRLTFWRCPDEWFGDEKKLVAWLKKLPAPIGILASNDRIALKVSLACRGLGLKIPEQVALTGVDNETEICRLANPPMTSINHGTRRIGYEAARLLDAWITHGVRPAQTVLVQPIGVVPRQSTDLLAIQNPHVVAALRFIREHAGDALKTEDVLEHVTLSRRALELHFQQLLGRTVHEEIMRVRMERAKQLLITSDQNILQIAAACGFAFPSQFSHAFKREIGAAPQDFRKQYRYR